MGRGDDTEMRSRNDVAGGEYISDRGVEGVIDLDHAFVVASAAELHGQVVGRPVAYREEDSLARYVRAVLERQGAYGSPIVHHSRDTLRADRDTECIELGARGGFDAGIGAVGADGDPGAPRAEREGHADGALA